MYCSNHLIMFYVEMHRFFLRWLPLWIVLFDYTTLFELHRSYKQTELPGNFWALFWGKLGNVLLIRGLDECN